MADRPAARTARPGRHRRRPQGFVQAGLRFLGRRPRVLCGLAGWSALEAAHTFALGFALARALDDGFLAGRPATGLAWLAVAGAGLLAGALGTARVHRQVAALAEPLRDELVRRVVGRALHEAVTATGNPGGGVGEAADASGTGAVSRLTHQVEIARDSFAGLVMVSRSFAVTLVGAVAGLAALAPELLLVVVPPLLAGLAVFAGTLRVLARRQRDVLVADEELAREAGNTVRALRDVAACGAGDAVLRSARRRIDAERWAADALARWGIARAVALGIGGRLPVVLLLVLAPWLLRQGVGAGALAGALTYLTQALLPALQSLVHGLGGAGARLAVVLRRLREGAPPAPVRKPDHPEADAAGLSRHPVSEPVPHGGDRETPHGGGRETPHGRGREGVPGNGGREVPALELRGVTFGYGPGAEPVLRGLDLTVAAGGHLAVVGPSGAGKSTLALLIAGLLRPTAGEVLLYGRPLSAAPEGGSALLCHRVLIPQESYVFSGSVRENLCCLLPERAGAPADAALSGAVAAVGACGLVRRLGGLDGRVDPTALSAGERQQLGLARAWLTPAPLAVLDEASSQLDPAAEERAEDAFRRRGGTLIVIAHRISSALRADRVLVLDGAGTRCGTHAELREHSPLYRDLTASWAPGPRV
ncbi:ATP-binding cassette domain-containing protein [Streptomyces albus subsp. chlorinus]|uniref:ATP-binding cassette domain-containing protein n=1 Tax=Streptomyces albus TaxID=1888 RepID=UPI00156E9C86|nr:ABC transporter ATP-binding protein [Streptomyces albus]NSC25013.1 ATP-binding cassette domain-containing protein [Streptomyces albus subsp. chlorinus]